MSNFTDGLIGYWTFDGTDVSGNGNTLALQGGATFGQGLFGQALSLDGQLGSYAAALTNNTAFDFGSGDFTVQIWVDFNTLSGEETLIEKFTGAAGPGWTFTLPNPSDLQFYAGPQVDAGVAVPTDTWQQFVVERSGSDVNVFWDGSLVATASFGAWPASTNPLLIGARNSEDGRNFTVNGSIDDVAIWDHTLSASEIAALWNGGAGQPVVPDTTAPLLLSITQTDPTLTNASTVHYTVTFAESVTGVDASQFSLATTGVSGASITDVTEVSGSNGTQYDVTVNTGSGDGTVGLDLAGANIHDTAGNTLLGGSFQSPIGYQPVAHPAALAIGDLNGDAIPDLVVADTGLYIGNTSVAVMLGNGDGTLQAATAYATGTSPFSVAIGDLSGDGIPDLATANADSNSVSVLLGNGDGSFQTQTQYLTGAYPISVAIGDVNGDNIADLATANFNSNTVSILLGSGDGTFQPQTTYAAGTYPFSVALGDLNGDGGSDLVITNRDAGSVSVRLSNGDGTFQPEITYATASPPNAYDVAIGDLNGDGIPDLLVGDANAVSVLLGNGDGTFGASTGYGTSGGSVAIADINGDGKADIIAGHEVMLGNGDGTFQSPIGLATDGAVAVGDLNNDGRPDLAFANYNANSVPGASTISILLNVAATGPSFTIDKTTPAVAEALASDTGSLSSDNITKDATLTGSGDANAVVSFTVDGTPIVATTTANGSGAWTFTPTGLADGLHTIVASETDAAGNTGSASLTFTLDTHGPTGWQFTLANSNFDGAASIASGTVIGSVSETGDPNSSTFKYFFASNAAGTLGRHTKQQWNRDRSQYGCYYDDGGVEQLAEHLADRRRSGRQHLLSPADTSVWNFR
jgi:hypothetical protein